MGTKIKKLNVAETREIYAEVLAGYGYIKGMVELEVEALGERYKSFYLAERPRKARAIYERYYDRTLMLGTVRAEVDGLFEEYKAIEK